MATEIYQKPDVNITLLENWVRSGNRPTLWQLKYIRNVMSISLFSRTGWVGEPADSVATEIYQKCYVNIAFLENWVGSGNRLTLWQLKYIRNVLSISLFSRTGLVGEPAEIYQKLDVNITLLENWFGRGNRLTLWQLKYIRNLM